MLLRRIVICIFRWLQNLSLKETSPDDTARIVLLTASASALFPSSTTPGLSPGAIARAGIVADAFYAKDSAFVTY
jgi:hypothetical protein